MDTHAAIDARPSAAPDVADPGVLWCDDASGLAGIAADDVRLAIWRRTLPSALDAALRAGGPEALPELCFTAAPAAAGPALRRRFKANAVAGPLLPLADDVARLIRLFAAAVPVERAHVRLERIAHDSCRLFHVDCVPVRLITTYVGATTEYLPEHAIRRAALGKGRNERICRDPAAVRCLPRHAVGLFKGSANAGKAGGAVHRSPPVEAAGEYRYMLVIDDAAAVGAGAISCA